MSLARVALAATLVAGAAASALASSHREAPFITEIPKCDGTDFYIFQSFDPGDLGANDTTILIANFGPLQDPNGGPNYFSMDEQAVFEIHLDSSGDAVEDLTFRFRFDNVYMPPSVSTDDGTQVELPFVVRPPGPITGPNDPDLGMVQFYTMDIVVGSGPGAQVFPALNPTLGGPQFIKPLDAVGEVTIPNYEGYANQHVWNWNAPGVPGAMGRVFVGQRDDPFYSNLGEVFDPTDSPDSRGDRFAHHNVTSFALALPTGFLTNGGAVSTIGAWSTASLRQTRLLNLSPTNPDNVEQPPPPGTPLVQVSRLGNPLVNMLMIGLGMKDRFNNSLPSGDAQFDQFFTHPALAELLGFPSANRADVRGLFLQGVPGLNQNGSSGELLRLNVEIQPVAAAQQNELGALAPAPDLAGYPNGRRPADDVVDIVLKVLAGDMDSPISDGVRIAATDYPTTFPFLGAPDSGSEVCECVVLTSSTSPQAGFQQVETAFADPARANELIAPLEAPDLQFYLVETMHPPDVTIRSMSRDGDRIRFTLER